MLGRSSEERGYPRNEVRDDSVHVGFRNRQKSARLADRQVCAEREAREEKPAAKRSRPGSSSMTAFSSAETGEDVLEHGTWEAGCGQDVGHEESMSEGLVTIAAWHRRIGRAVPTSRRPGREAMARSAYFDWRSTSAIRCSAPVSRRFFLLRIPSAALCSVTFETAFARTGPRHSSGSVSVPLRCGSASGSHDRHSSMPRTTTSTTHRTFATR